MSAAATRVSSTQAASAHGRGRAAWAATLLLLAWTPCVEARLQTGGLVLEVVDTAGGPLPSIGILLEGPRLAGPLVRETDAHGRAHFSWLPPGSYTAEVEAEGYVGVRTRHDVALGATRVDRLVMTPGEMVESQVVEVSRVDATQNGIDVRYGREVLQATQLGSRQRSDAAVAGQAPGVAPGADPVIHGASVGENRYLVDGIDTTSTSFGTRSKSLPFDAIEAVELKTGAFHAEYGLATGGIINAVTRSGSDTFEGSLDVRYSDQRLIESSPYHDDVDQDDRDVAFTLGGPLVRERLWFFLAASDRRSQIRPTGAPVTRSLESSTALAKLTWQPRTEHRLSLQWSRDPRDIENADAAPERAPEATTDRHHGGHLFSVSWWGRFANRWGVSLQAGYQSISDGVLSNGDPNTPPRYNAFNAHLSGNASLSSRHDQVRRQLAVKAERIGGSSRWHHVRFGVELQDTSHWWESRRPGPDLGGVTDGTTGPYRERVDHDPDADGDGVDEDPFGRGPAVPIERWDVWLFPDRSRTNLRVASTYAQDTWHVADRVTLDLGLRLDAVTVDGAGRSRVASFSELQPRIGLGIDLTGRARHVLSLHVGRFMDPGFLNPFSQVGFGDSMQLFEIYANELHVGDCDRDGTIERGRTLCLSYGGPGKGAIDPDLSAMSVDEATLGSRHELGGGATLGARYVFRQTNDIVNWTFDADTEVWTVRNQPWLVRRYNGLELDIGWERGRWHAFGNWTLSWTKGNVEYTAGTGFVFFDLATSRNRYGYLARDRRHRVKSHGWVDLPRRWRLAWDGTWVSGAPYDRVAAAPTLGVEYLEPRGSRRLGSYHLLDVEARKTWDAGPLDVTLIATVLNVTGADDVVRVGEFPGDFQEPLDYLQPRRYEAGLRLTW